MGSKVKLLYIYFLTFKFDNCSFVVVNVTIIWSAENSYYYREPRLRIPFVHFITFQLGLMRSYHRKKIVLLKELIDSLLPKEVGAASYIIRFE